MTEIADPITGDDLEAFVDEQLPLARRIEVQDHLARHPELAARMMADLSHRDTLRLAFGRGDDHLSPVIVDCVETLSRKLQPRGGLLGRFRHAAAVAAVGVLGFGLHAATEPAAAPDTVAWSPAPGFVDDAVKAHHQALERGGVAHIPASRVETEAVLGQAAALPMPSLPEGWQVSAVQTYPSSFGPGVEMVVAAGSLGTLSLFAVRPGNFTVTPVTVAAVPDLAAVYWQVGDVAYALTGGHDTAALARVGRSLSTSLY
ncbi:anti-sigma factor family protein [Zavarzinia compransoris]|uniref:Fis family transcriptional regulator n=1 Tax=Zavarzinia compransoris TaxID=1264899 RepID=A0A317DTU4_9PROT|nr:Fis family transcriptional regulator [Zavarzinia compransoris]PWR18071.1 Fis family transcriptional regulator [Zavarzinia compransoris]TDP43456.1 anti-sigma factor RsiW [Zavarzinia compransoris]